MVEGEKIVFKLSKALWNECRERDLKLLERLEAKEAELAYHKTMVLQSTCSTCSQLSFQCSCLQQIDQNSLPVKISGKRGRKRKLSEDKWSHQNILTQLLRLRKTLSEEELASYVPSQQYEQYFTMVPSLTKRDLIQHLIFVRVEFVPRLMRPLIQKLMSHPRNGDIFNHPVDPVALGLRDYFQRIPRPMDLGTMRCHLLQGDYHSIEECADDVNLVFNNAITYNPPSHLIHQNALLLREEFQGDLQILQDKLAKEEEKKSQHSCEVCHGSLCLVCGERCLKLEPTILVCYGPCGQRIKKQGTYYVSTDGALLWCQKCYTAANSVIVEADGVESTPLMKKSLLKRRFDEEAVESWIDCHTCGRRIHQACGLYNDLHNSKKVEDHGGAPSLYECPLCKLNLSMDTNQKKKDLQTPKKTKSDADHFSTISPSVSERMRGSDLHRPQNQPRSPTVSVIPFAKISAANSDLTLTQVHTVSFSTHDSVQLIEPVESIQGQRTGSSDTSDESSDPHEANQTPQPETEESDCEESEYGDESAPVAEEDDSMCVVTDNDGELDEEEEQKSISEKRAVSTHCASLVEEIVDKIFPPQPPKRLFGRQRKSQPSLLKHAPAEQWKATSLPQTKLSDFIESMVQERLEQCGFGDVMQSLTIRMTSNCFHNFEVPEVILNNLPTSDGYHVNASLYYKQKCILLFQNIDGVDVCLFCLYVQEFDDTCPEPNRSKVYIAYLDSVEYFRPRCVRTTVYHEILVAYLIWCRARGFKQCHIWACPPQRGDNFIFWCHNPQQRNPSRDRLNSWYNSMLTRAGQLGLLKSIDTLWATYFSPYGKRDELSQRTASKNSFVSKNSLLLASKAGNINRETEIPPPVCPPIFEGDFWVNECDRVYHLVQVRSKGVEGQDKNVNLRKCRDLLKSLMSKPMMSTVFNQPVDPVVLNIPDYPTIVTCPMDLGTVRNKLRSNQYSTVLDFAKDVRLTFTNAMLYNPQSHPIHILAQKLLEDFEQTLYDIVTERLGMSQNPEIDHSLETFPLCNFPKSVREESNPSTPNPEKMGQETSCLTRRVSFCETDCKRERQRSSSMCSLSSLMNDDDEADSKHQSENEEGDVLPGLSRQDSTESVLSMNDWPRRPDHTTSQVCRDISGQARPQTERKIFEKSQLGPKGVMTLMSELSRNVCRLKDDMYVITLSDVSSADLCPSPSFPCQTSSDIDLSKVPENSSTRGGKGKGKGLSVIGTSPPSSSAFSATKDSEKIPTRSLALLEHIKSDTSDPDEPINNPFIDSRQTFLEMCQYRHYQFDSLRRAKASSVMLLYHLLYPQSKETRPVCSECHSLITTVRWHCTLCPDSRYDVCNECLSLAQLNHEHQELTPIRLTYF